MKRLELTDAEFEALSPTLREEVTRQELARAQRSREERGIVPEPEFRIPKLEGWTGERKKAEDARRRMTSGGGFLLDPPEDDPLSI